MTIFYAIILGILQGIAEFLPISSSGHLALAQHLLGLKDIPLLFDVFLHLATLGAVILFFRKKIWMLLCVFCRMCIGKKADAEENLYRRYILGVILATLVTGAIGILVEKKLNALPVKFICGGFIITSILLLIASFVEKRNKRNVQTAPLWWQSLIIGFAQGLGTLPGISRSGATISGSLLCGVTREVAGEFSFIASIPAIVGAFFLELKDLGEVGTAIGIEPVVAGCAAAFASGFIALTLLMKMIRNGKLGWFAVYLVPVGIIGLLFL